MVIAPEPNRLPADAVAWRGALLHGLADADACFKPLGHRHDAILRDGGPTLLVTFEEAGALRARGGNRLPLGLQMAQAQDWSLLTILAEGETWFRDPHLFRYMDRLIDRAFFDDFDHVVFCGAGMGGYAAAAYAASAPGAAVVALAPRATLDPSLTGWDPRHRAARRLTFTDRFGYGPDMIEAASRAFVIYDPAETWDAMHAALYRRPNVTLLKARWLGGDLGTVFARLGLLEPLLMAALDGRLDHALFARTLRVRRLWGPYLRRMLAEADRAGHAGRARAVARAMTAQLSVPRLRARIEALETGAPEDQFPADTMSHNSAVRTRVILARQP